MELYKTPSDALADPAFRQATPDTQRFALRQLDAKGWGSKPDEEIDAFIKKLKPAWDKENQTNAAIAQQVQTLPAPSVPQKSRFKRLVAPVTEAVGRGMEAATVPAVGLSRMLQGEPAGQAFGKETFASVGHGGAAQKSRTEFGEALVPQEAWQAGAMALPVGGKLLGAGPAVAKLGSLGRIGLGGALAGGAHAAVEGGTFGEQATSAAKGAGANVAGEMLGRALGPIRRHAPGAKRRISDEGAGAFMDVAGESSRAAIPAGLGGKGASQRLVGEQATDVAQSRIEQELHRNLQAVQAQFQPGQGFWSPILDRYYRSLGGTTDEASTKVFNALRPDPHGQWNADQVMELIAKAKDDIMKTKMDSTGKVAGSWAKVSTDLVRDVVDQLKFHLQNTAAGRANPAVGTGLEAARRAYAKGQAVRDMLQTPALMSPTARGPRFEQRAAEEMLRKEGPRLIRELGRPAYDKLVDTVTRGGGLGAVDVPAGNWATPGMSVWWTTLRNLARGPAQYAGAPGRRPMTTPQGRKSDLNALSQLMGKTWKEVSTEE